MLHTPKRRGASSAIPNSHAPGALSVTDGTTCVDTIAERDHSHFAFDAIGTLLGEYGMRIQAMHALPSRGAS